MQHPSTIRRSVAPFGALGVLVGFAFLCVVALVIGLLCDGSASDEDAAAAPGRSGVRLTARRSTAPAGRTEDRAVVRVAGRAPSRRGAPSLVRLLRMRDAASFCPASPSGFGGAGTGGTTVAWRPVSGSGPGRELRARRSFAMTGVVRLDGARAQRLCAYLVRGGPRPRVQRRVSAVVPERVPATRTAATGRPEVRTAAVPLRPGALALVLSVAIGVAWVLRRVPAGASSGPSGPSSAGAVPGPEDAPAVLEAPGAWPSARFDTHDLPPLPPGFVVPDALPPGDLASRGRVSWAWGGAGRRRAVGGGPDHPTTDGAGTHVPVPRDGLTELAVDLPAGLHVLHDLRIPNVGGRIDHLLVGPGGVVVANSKDHAGRVRSDGLRLRAGRRNCSGEVDVCLWQAETVRALLQREGLGLVPVHGVLHWLRPAGLGAQSIDLRGVRVLSARETLGLALEGGLLEPDVTERVLLLLARAFPNA